MRFTRYLKTCRTRYQNISFTLINQRTQAKDEKDNRYQEIGKKPDPTNLKDLSDYIQPFTHLFNKRNLKNC